MFWLWYGPAWRSPPHGIRSTIGNAAAPAVANLRGVVDELVEPGRDEVVELHLADRPLARERRADADAEHRALGERRVQDPVAEVREQRAQQQKRIAVLAAHVLAVDEDARIRARARRPRRAATASRNVLPFGSKGGPVSSGGMAVSAPPRAAGSSGSAGRRGASPAKTRAPARLGLGPRRLDDRSRLAPRRRSAASCSKRARSSACDHPVGLEARGVERDRIAARPVLVERRGRHSRPRGAGDSRRRSAAPCRDRACRRGARARKCACRRARSAPDRRLRAPARPPRRTPRRSLRDRCRRA